MNISKPNNAHRIYFDAKKVGPKYAKQMRATLGERFKILLLDAGLSPEQAGKELHVSPRTIRYWISGKVLVPYAAYRLIRIMRLFDLPCQGWDGWHMHSGRLWSPEGYAFLPHDANWWALLVRRAEGFGRQYARANQLDVALQRLQERACEGAAGTNETGEAGALGRAALPGQNTLKTEFTPRHSNTGGKLSANITSWNLGDFPSLGLALKCWSKVTSTKSGSGYRGRSP